MKPYLHLWLTGSLIAGLYALSKLAGSHGVAPLSVLLWQVAGGAIGLSLWALLRRQAPGWSRAELRYYLTSGLLGVTVPGVLAYTAVQSLGVGMVAMLTALSTLLTYLGAVVMRTEPASFARLAGCGLGLLGVAVLSAPGSQGGGEVGALLAALLVPVSLALGNLYRTHAWPPGAAPMALATGMLLLQLPLVLILVASQGLPWWPAADAGGLVWLVWIAAMAPLIYLLSFRLQQQGGPVMVSQLGYVMTVMGAVIGAGVFGEDLGRHTLLAMGLIIAGLVLVNRRSSRERSTPSLSAEQRVAG